MEEQKNLLSDFLNLSTPALITLAVLVAVAVAALVLLRRQKSAKAAPVLTTQMLVYGAMSIAIAFVLSFIKLYRMPQGGSLTPGSMLPLMGYAYMFGPGPGLLCAGAYGFLQLLQDLYVVHPMQLILDYPLAFGLIGLAGFSRRSLIPGVLVGGLGRIVAHILSGAIFFAEYAPQGQSALIYSIGYNAAVLLPDLAICMALAAIPATRRMFDRLKSGVIVS